MNIQEQLKKIEGSFDTDILYQSGKESGRYGCMSLHDEKLFKDFANTSALKLLKTAYEEERDRVEGMKKSCGDPFKFRLSDEDIGFNIALTDYLTHLNTKIAEVNEIMK